MATQDTMTALRPHSSVVRLLLMAGETRRVPASFQQFGILRRERLENATVRSGQLRGNRHPVPYGIHSRI
jgi:hypothetical protein